MSYRPQPRSFAALFHVSVWLPWAHVRWMKLHQPCREENCGIHLSSTLQWNSDLWLQGAPQDTASSHASVRIPRCVLAAISHIHLLSWFKSSISDSRSLFSRLEHWSVAVFTCYGSAPLPLPARGSSWEKRNSLSPQVQKKSHKMEISDQILYIPHKNSTNILFQYGTEKNIACFSKRG